jgi:hypothetical protein
MLAERDERHNHPGHDSNFKEFSMALTDTAVRQAKATGVAYTLGDMDGLSLAVSPQGGKSRHFRYYWNGKQKRMSLGTYPEVPLREARQARDEARALLAKGTNPHTHRKQKRQAVLLAGEHTFESVFHAWLERQGNRMNLIQDRGVERGMSLTWRR